MKNVLVIKLGDGVIRSKESILDLTKMYRESIDEYGMLILPDNATWWTIYEVSDVKVDNEPDEETNVDLVPLTRRSSFFNFFK